MKTLKELKEEVLQEVDAVFNILFDADDMTYEEEEKLNERFLKPLKEIVDMGESEEVLEVLFEFLTIGGSDVLREESFKALEKMSHSKIAEMLLDWLNSKDEDRYDMAMSAMSTISSIISGHRVFANSGDSREKPGQFPLMDELNKPGGVIDRIIEVLKKGEKSTHRSRAVGVLGGIGTDVKKIQPLLEEALKQTDSERDYECTEYALECLKKYNQK